MRSCQNIGVLRGILTNKNKPELIRYKLIEVAFKLSYFHLACWPMVSATIPIERVPVTKNENGRVLSKTVLWSFSLLPNGQSCVGTTKHGRVVTMGDVTVDQLSNTTIRGIQTQPQPLKHVEFLN